MTTSDPINNNDWDKNAALNRLDGDEELYEEILALFKEEAPKDLLLLAQALEESKLADAQRIAHSMKSAAGNVGAIGIQKVALKLEMALKAGETTNYKIYFEDLDQALKRALSD
jgi:two-component system sensor histidine kinase/response regulator